MRGIHELPLAHYSAEIVKKVRSANQDWFPNEKPNGFWISVEDELSWPRFISNDRHTATLGKRNKRFKHKHIVTFSPSANILWLETPKDLFNLEEFGKLKDDSIAYIYWRILAKQFDGILISPYQYQCRCDKRCWWYNTWDCASGCIWNSKAVQSISLHDQGRVRA